MTGVNKRARLLRHRFLAMLLGLLFLRMAGAAELPAPELWRVLIEPKFINPPVSVPIPGAERTVLAAGWADSEEVRYFSKEEFEALGLEWEEFVKQALAGNGAEFAKLQPNLIRNRKKVIERAEILSENPLAASAVLAPGFLKTFEQTLGPEILVVVPNRFTVLVFPKLVGSYAEFADRVMEEYRATSHPVSVEVFEISQAGIRAVGLYEQP